MATDALLAVQGLRAGYGETEVLRGIDLDVGSGEIVAVLGSNGVGKSTLNRTISGILRPRAGAIRFDGDAIERAKPSGDRRARAHPCAGGPPHLPQSDGAREPRSRQLSPRRANAARKTANASSRSSRALPSGNRSAPARCRAASSRCSPSAAA